MTAAPGGDRHSPGDSRPVVPLPTRNRDSIFGFLFEDMLPP